MFRFSFFVLAVPLIFISSAQARPVAPQVLPPGPAVGPDYISFSTINSTIDCQMLKDPLLVGSFTSDVATIEVSSSAGIQLSYSNGSDLKSGQSTIPTTFEFALLGPARFDGKELPARSDYTDFSARTPNQNGVIEFPRTPIPTTKGIQARVIAQRSGLNDKAGKYETQIVLSWARF